MGITNKEYFLLFVIAYLLVGALTPLMRRIAIARDVIDRPNSSHKSHKQPVPYLGGVAIALGITITTLAAVYVGGNKSGENAGQLKDLALTVLLPALLLGAMGLIDDLRSLSPWPRLIAQSVVGTVVALVIVKSGTTGTPFGTSTLNTVVTIFWIVGICNSINFFDNLDGAAAGAVARATGSTGRAVRRSAHAAATSACYVRSSR